ncbi:MAG: polyprenyl synthetase family protein [Bacteroidales bacterium]|nr:polyprenyl synthetase family protein [Bacteroidales bacterium]
MSRETVLSILGTNWTSVQRIIADSLRSDVGLLNIVNAEILSHGGKMLRPMVCLLMAGACGEINEDSCLYAAASELLHNATLLHDDVADESDTRRGMPTMRSRLGPSRAVLLGDFWLAKSVDTILQAKSAESVRNIFSRTLSDLAEGEMLQLEKSGTADTSEADYLRIIHCKTASLFETAGLSGAVSAGAPQSYIEAAGEYSRALGTAFQIKDDILDYTGDGSLGKPVGIDLLEKKITLPLLCAMKDSPREAEIRKAVLQIDSHRENYEEISKFVAQRGGVEKAAEVLDKYVEKAQKALEILPKSRYTECLAEIARFNAIRTK